MEWNRGAKTIANFQTLRQEVIHKLRSVVDSVGKISQLEAAVIADPTWKAEVEAAIVGTGPTLPEIATDIDGFESTRDTILVNHPELE